MIVPAQCQPGSLDLNFGSNGIAISPLTEYRELLLAIAVQPDGKIVVAGLQEISSSGDMAVARYNADGSPDNTFGTNGFAAIDLGTDSDAAWCMALQDDGKILLGGSVNNQFTTVDDYALVRINTDGILDNSFGTGGIVVTDVDGFWDNAFAIDIQSDGKIILAGNGYSDDQRNCCLVRYNSDGSLDATFGIGGIAMNSIGLIYSKTRDVEIQDDGKIVAVGHFNDGDDDHTFVTRFNADGSVDNSFGNNGAATLDVAANDDSFLAVCIQPDGKILAAGFTYEINQENDVLVVRYNTDGTLDNTFGNGSGIYLHNFNTNDIITDLVLQPDGKILTAGGAYNFELARLMTDGSKDFSFGVDGVVNTPVGNYSNSEVLCLYGDNMVVVGGSAHDGSEYNFAVTRHYLDESGGIADQQNVFSKISVYPNPNIGDQITLEYVIDNTEVLSAEILSVSGKKIDVLINTQLRAAGHHEEDLRMPANLSAGIYFIRLFTEKENIYQKIVIP